LKIALAQAEEIGLIGKNILDTDFSFTLHIMESAGAKSMRHTSGTRGARQEYVKPF
jgi:hypothetical protein